nr:MAG TPA: hypothetical protein [Caudoviricetes sp.]
MGFSADISDGRCCYILLLRSIFCGKNVTEHVTVVTDCNRESNGGKPQ